MDLELFHQNMDDLLAGKSASIPFMIFKNGKNYPSTETSNGRRPNLDSRRYSCYCESCRVPISLKRNKRKIFISFNPNQSLMKILLSLPLIARLIRHIVRDARLQGLSPITTLNHWDEVRRGEHCNIFPYQEGVDSLSIRRFSMKHLPVLRPLIEDQLAANRARGAILLG